MQGASACARPGPQVSISLALSRLQISSLPSAERPASELGGSEVFRAPSARSSFQPQCGSARLSTRLRCASGAYRWYEARFPLMSKEAIERPARSLRSLISAACRPVLGGARQFDRRDIPRSSEPRVGYSTAAKLECAATGWCTELQVNAHGCVFPRQTGCVC